jgi:hypothetical protein
MLDRDYGTEGLPEIFAFDQTLGWKRLQNSELGKHETTPVKRSSRDSPDLGLGGQKERTGKTISPSFTTLN